MDCKAFVRVRHVQIMRDMLNGMWIGFLAISGARDFWVHSLDFGEVITEMEATIGLLEAS